MISDSNSKENLPMVEKYRPNSLNEIVAHEEILATLKVFESKKAIPHLLFHGPPGTGKTSCVLALAKTMYPKNFRSMVLELNASDDRGINVVRNKIKEFCMTQLINNSGIKLIVLDEADFMTAAAQNALRRVMEKYTKNARFCLICNQVNKIIPAIQSRCTKFRFSPLKPEQALSRVNEICQFEGIQVEKEAIESLVHIGKGDMRKVLNLLESTFLSTGGKVDLDSIFATAGLPSDQDILKITEIMLLEDSGTAMKTLEEFKMVKGLAINDISLRILELVRNSSLTKPLKIKLMLDFEQLGETNNLGGSEKIMLGSLIGIFQQLKNENIKSLL